jgi:tetratricopeptide (TPR) repeat protein
MLRSISVAERCMLVALIGYSLVMIRFLYLSYRGNESALTRYLVALCGLCLTLVIPEFVRKRRLPFRVCLMLVPTIGIGLLQTENEVRIARLSRQMENAELQQIRGQEVRAREAQLIEEIILEPVSAIENGEYADEGFVIKADRLGVLVFKREARLLVDHPELANEILTAPEIPQAKLEKYQRLALGDPHLMPALDPVLAPLRAQVTYLDIADFFRRQMKPKYRLLENGIRSKALFASDACNQILGMMTTLRQFAALHPAAGLYNHIGTMVLSCGRPEEALGLFYDALAADSDHVTAYESLSFALWIFNKDSANALEFADRGLQRSLSEHNAVEEDFRAGSQLYDSFGRRRPAYALLATHMIEAERKRVPRIQGRWAKFMNDMTDRLTNDYSYFSALELKNEKEARSYMTALYMSHPAVAEYQDSMGFVLMRFATQEGELQKAEELFTAAIRNPDAAPETPRLASTHLEELQALKAKVKGRARVM